MPDNKILVSRPYYQGLGLGLETWWPRSWSRDLVAKVLVSRPGGQGLGLELFSKVLITSLVIGWGLEAIAAYVYTHIMKAAIYSVCMYMYFERLYICISYSYPPKQLLHSLVHHRGVSLHAQRDSVYYKQALPSQI